MKWFLCAGERNGMVMGVSFTQSAFESFLRGVALLCDLYADTDHSGIGLRRLMDVTFRRPRAPVQTLFLFPR